MEMLRHCAPCRNEIGAQVPMGTRSAILTFIDRFESATFYDFSALFINLYYVISMINFHRVFFSVMT